ncbi:DNA polymerase III subunit alpha [Rhodohalobacter barkolensis]|uniref:DNA polymerase III subunit alpha n=1 Tax=Rhodohalobacter barkolensis TaxID=2053187 RepID=A0A2N0VG40_9BACT|nr:DNA polymerase III subunit alpha [Rhodohalobacter barkolensis]PKD43149.1 DNA polymerase III subunit alpha [Rhodohalobacter barkolensis]
MYLIFDTETTGLPQNYSAPLTDFDNWPRCVQLAWQVHDVTGKLISSGDYIVKPDGFTIPFNSEKVHGISTERAHAEGIPLNEVMDIFNRELERCTFVIGHNLEFDLNIMGSEYLRMERENPLTKKVSIDTKDESTEFCAIPGGRGRYKWPTLAELHDKLFEIGFEEAHNAAADVDATARAFLELVRIGVIRPNHPQDPSQSPANPAQKIEESHYMPKVEELRQRGVTGEEDDQSSAIDLPKESAGVKVDSPFSHLHNHSKFSVLQAASGVKDLVKKAKEDGMPAVAMTDLGNMYGTFHFTKAAYAEGIKPIIGLEAYFVEDRHQKKFTRDHKDKRYQQIFLAKNMQGYRNLAEMCSLGFIEGYYYKFPRIDRELVEKYREGLIATTGGLLGEVPDLILNRGEEVAEEALKWWHDLFGEDLYIEIMRHGLEEEERVNSVLLKFAEKYGIKVIATNNTFYMEKADAKAHDALLCIDNNESISTPIGKGREKRFGFPNDEFYFKTQEEMKALFADVPEAISNTQEVVDKIEEIKLERDVILPNFKLPEGFETEDDYLRHLTIEGAKKHYGELTDEVTERIDHELNIIKTMGFAGYFLIVQDFIIKAKEMGVYVGPGRGSAAGSVVAYCTGITNIDPLKYDLLFERFLNPERVSMPDIDIDFDDDGRQRVIDYVVDKYGKDQVAHIITFGTMAARSSVRDVARVLDLPLSDADRIAKLVPETIGISLEDAFKEVRELRDLKESDSLEGRTLQMAETLEGSVRNTGIHAAGVIIAPDKLTNYIPIGTAKDAELYVTQFDGKVIEDAGMLKMDFLGLKTLSILKTAIGYVKENHSKEYNLDDIPLDDEKTFEMFKKGATVGIFQFESDGMRKYLKQLKPTKIDDLIAMNALYRPGPMQFIPDYIKRKHGEEEVEYDHEDLIDILEPTYGIMIYQEQIMMVAQRMGGYSLGEADVLRRIMGKKKPELLPPEEEKFVKQAVEKGYDKKTAKEVFDKMAMFAGYGFNKSHSAAYSVVAYHTMYFKANYTAEYMAAVLSHNMNDIKKVSFFIEECQRIGIPVDAPNVNSAEGKFVAKDGRVQYGLLAIKGVGSNAIEELVKERDKKGKFSSIFDFSSRIDTRVCNRKTMESLAQAGAFDSLHQNRAQLVASIDDVINYASRKQEEERLNQVSLFGESSGGGGMGGEPNLRECPPWTNIERLNNERELIGFYLSGHPLDKFKEDVRLFASHSLNVEDLSKLGDREKVRVIGIITSVRRISDKKGRPMAFAQIEDLEGSTEVLIFSEVYDRHQGLIAPDTVLMLEGNLSKRDEPPKIIASSMERVENLREKFQAQLQLNIDLKTAEVSEDDLADMATLFSVHKGETPIKLLVRSHKAKKPLKMNVRKYVVEPNNELLSGLRNILDKNSVRLIRNGTNGT